MFIVKNANIVNEGEVFKGSVVVNGERIEKVVRGNDDDVFSDYTGCQCIDATDCYLVPGVIDEHVHFREPGLTGKADIQSESRAAAAGGVTSFMEMPNTVPNTLTMNLLEDKFRIAEEKSLINFSFYLGASNDNIDEIAKVVPADVCGIKLFMGSSTGNMLVDNDLSLARIFAESPCLIAAHCEDESIIRKNTAFFKEKYGSGAPASIHPLVRDEEACYRSSAHAVELADKYGARLHVTHISTERELGLFDNSKALKNKKITAETCVHYLHFSDADYQKFGFRIKCNPAIKTERDREALSGGVKSGIIDTIATDHAPHRVEEKFVNDYFKCPSGFPSVQHSLLLMLEMCRDKIFDIETVVTKMAHNPAILYQIKDRGFIREGYYADFAIVNPKKETVVSKDNILYKCGWSPYEGTVLHNTVTHTFVNGNLVFADGVFDENNTGKRLKFNRI